MQTGMSFIPNKGSNFISGSENFADKERALSIIESFIDYSKFNSFSSILANIESNNQLIKDIKNKLHSSSCARCKDANELVVAECGHKYCLMCAKQLLTENCECSVCSTRLSHRFQLKIMNTKKKLNKGDPRVLCVKCGNREIRKYLAGKCNHLCIYCVQQSYETFNTECCECFEPLFNDSSYFEQTELCQGCGLAKYIIGDFLATLSCGHLLCIQCHEEAIKSKQCKICRIKLNSLQILTSLNKSCSQCSDCLSIFSKTFITKKTCCKIDLCKNCEESHRCQLKSINFRSFT